MGFIHSAECEIMRNSALVNVHMVHYAATSGAKRYFFSSSACVYRDMTTDEPELSEEEAYPAMPDNEYGWEKLYAERMAMAYGRKFGMEVRIARFQNCYGPEGTWTGGREKAPAALSRKISLADEPGTIEVWGDGTAMRAYTFIEDMVAGIYMLMQSDHAEPTNIGRREYVSVDELVKTIAEVAGKPVNIEHIDGPVGVKARNFLNDKIHELGWESKFSLKDGMSRTYPWVKAQAEAQKNAEE
jgi:nucleoside-diphosphate-sugar epimerase